MDCAQNVEEVVIEELMRKRTWLISDWRVIVEEIWNCQFSKIDCEKLWMMSWLKDYCSENMDKIYSMVFYWIYFIPFFYILTYFSTICAIFYDCGGNFGYFGITLLNFRFHGHPRCDLFKKSFNLVNYSLSCFNWMVTHCFISLLITEVHFILKFQTKLSSILSFNRLTYFPRMTMNREAYWDSLAQALVSSYSFLGFLWKIKGLKMIWWMENLKGYFTLSNLCQHSCLLNHLLWMIPAKTEFGKYVKLEIYSQCSLTLKNERFGVSYFNKLI